ncbi:hypothetical protein RND71_025827 [Anisodus tanguticus]|uniref:Uncharacterized protein n=1 Tax=Anisodus tanguticus TaxID=243964 RepID=A0AAE1V2A1_9SOLA|nr:hypothetical protein RND71_025827 [Anisodus tanguticus]
MSLHRTKATFIGLFEVGRVNEWVVTKKLGDALKTKMSMKAPKKSRFWIGERYNKNTCYSSKYALDEMERRCKGEEPGGISHAS